MATNYTEALGSLMQEKKKKKKVTKSDQKKFYHTWLEMTSETGFDDTAEMFLYYGFGFCGTAAFVKYLKDCENPQQELLKLMNGKRFSEDSNTTFRVLINTLAHLLNEKAPEELIAVIMRYLPNACLNKEGKPLGTAPKSFEKYFLSVLNPFVELPQLSCFSAKPSVINTFCTIISGLLDEVKKSSQADSGSVSDQLKQTARWIECYTESLLDTAKANQKSEKLVEEGTPSQKLTESQPAPTEAEVPIPPVNCIETGKNIDPVDQIAGLLSMVKSLTFNIGQKNRTLEEEVASLTRSLSEKLQSINELEAKLKNCSEQIEQLKEQLVAKEGDKVVLMRTISDRDQVIQQKNAEIEERTKMTDILSRDRTRQSSEIVQKLASKIRVEYRDFSDAEGLPMTCDLGENMRLQLQSVFDILEKGGMKIK